MFPINVLSLNTGETAGVDGSELSGQKGGNWTNKEDNGENGRQHIKFH